MHDLCHALAQGIKPIFFKKVLTLNNCNNYFRFSQFVMDIHEQGRITQQIASICVFV